MIRRLLLAVTVSAAALALASPAALAATPKTNVTLRPNPPPACTITATLNVSPNFVRKIQGGYVSFIYKNSGMTAFTDTLSVSSTSLSTQITDTPNQPFAAPSSWTVEAIGYNSGHRQLFDVTSNSVVPECS